MRISDNIKQEVLKIRKQDFVNSGASTMYNLKFQNLINNDKPKN